MHADYSFSFGGFSTLPFVEEIYKQYLKEPQKVEQSWRFFFEGMEFAESEGGISREEKILGLIEAYRTFGHLKASINPLDIGGGEKVNELELKTLGFEESDLDRLFPSAGLLESSEATLREVIEALERTYCRSVAIQYMGCRPQEIKKWLQSAIEPTRFSPSLSLDQKKKLLGLLSKAELFEIFLHTKYVGQKRFSLEGGETLIPILWEIIEAGAALGIEECVIGMPHRGRLNVLANILHKSYGMIFSEFEDYFDPLLPEESGDVKYHKGFSSNVPLSDDRKIHIALTANPSHLESVDPVVEGKVRAKQMQRDDRKRESIVPILIHGDGSLAGQGVVYETMQLSRLPGYTTGGTIHIVVNNQIGFTTLPFEGRSTHYCTDIGATFLTPIFHVNAEEPEGCIYVARLAIELRQKFGCDVFIDMNCYRKYGHNESDEPAFTQPLQYRLIREKKSIRELYKNKLIEEGAIEREVAGELEEQFQKALQEELQIGKKREKSKIDEPFKGVWEKYRKGTKEELFKPVPTAVEKPLLQELTKRLTAVPPGFHLHPKVSKLQEMHKKMVEEGKGIEWALAEKLAIASLLWEGVHVRLAGQDSQRGTFSQRHAVWVDQENAESYFPLSNLSERQAKFEIVNSPLSEFAALGFEFGYSLAYPSALSIWEAQFGDFANGAQIIIDQYLAASEQKWGRFSGLTLLLPHGYEGQGPEHSSARLERFLQLAGNANMQICNPTTPAQYFHLLRRQVLRTIRHPLVIFTPKGLLRHPRCISSLNSFSSGTFSEILADPRNSKELRRLLLCSGRVYFDLLNEREKRGKEREIALVRFEQLYPLSHDQLQKVFAEYEAVKEVCWVQEEPQNMGGFSYISPIVEQLLPKEVRLQFVGRPKSASPATGSHAMHEKEQKQLLDMAFQV